MVNEVHLTGEISFGQLGVIFSIFSTGFGIYLKSRLDVQRLNMQHHDMKTDVAALIVKVDAQASSLSELKIQLAGIQALTSYEANLPRVLQRFIDSRKGNGDA